jgi:hypothetical protein
MARKTYGSSKVLVASANMMMLGGIATLVSLRGPYGSGATSSAASAADQDDVQRVASYEFDDDEDDGGRYVQVPSSGPVAQSRGS